MSLMRRSSNRWAWWARGQSSHLRPPAADLKKRNPGTFEKIYKPLVPRNASAPVPIMLGALEGPAALAPLATDAPYFPLAMGPTWAGVPGARRVTYIEAKKNHTETVSVGGFVEGWALGAIPLRKNVALGTAPTGIADSLGIASMAPARLFLESLPPDRPRHLGGHRFSGHGAHGPRLGAQRRRGADDAAVASRRRRRRPEQHRRAVFAPARPRPPGDI